MLRLRPTPGNGKLSLSGELSSFGVSSGYADASPYTANPSNCMTMKDMDGGRRRSSGSSIDRFVVSCIAAIFIGTVAMYYRSSYHAALIELHTTQRIMKEVSYKHEEKKQAQINNNNNMIQQFEAERNYSVNRDKAWQEQLNRMQLSIQRENWRTVMERFGEDPHHVTFTLKFYEPQIQIASFKVELAPFHNMPHAVHFFLEQVYHELWDGTWFYLNGPHVLQAGPQDWGEENAGKSMARFREARLDQLSFPEYHHDFPHVPFTLGYTGRPGGPEWYINKVDNSERHGPGGLWHHRNQQEGLEEQADPCFAKVVEGHDVLQRMFHADANPANANYPYFLHQPVEILSARIDERVENRINKPQKTVNNSEADHHHPQRTNINQEIRDTEREKQQQSQ